MPGPRLTIGWQPTPRTIGKGCKQSLPPRRLPARCYLRQRPATHRWTDWRCSMNPLPTESQQPDSEAAVEVPKAVIDLSIYVMPAFATLAVSHLERSQR